jgi:uracil-DNA glycosylase
MPAQLVTELAGAEIGETFNFYRDGAGAEVRRARLRAYLGSRRSAPILLVGEAAGYRGARVSGIPFTSERQLSGSGPAEPTATIVRATLDELGLEEAVLCWNLVPTHPHLPGRPDSNRRPTSGEIEAARPFLEALLQGRRAIAVGRLAHAALGGAYIRHPSHGGAQAFAAGLIAHAPVSRELERLCCTPQGPFHETGKEIRDDSVDLLLSPPAPLPLEEQ